MVSGRKTDLERRRRVVELYEQGLSPAEIARQVGMSDQGVRYTLNAVQKEKARSVSCRRCKVAINPTGALPRNHGRALCLACLAKTPEASFGDRLLSLRLAHGLTVMDLARRAEVDAGALYEYETDKHEPTWQPLVRLVRVLGQELVVFGEGQR
ncbi:MAG: helix-turn-helix domain-containing protein [Gemmataceae bacterium]|nr:helix-turn-helix domain-containing protein [Gemmataceae bacterium]